MLRSRIATMVAAAGAAAVLATTATPAQSIVGGGFASAGEYPAMAAVYLGSPQSGQFCGGTLVRPTVVITAAHCILGLPAPHVTGVLIGRLTLNGTGGEMIPAAGFVIHPGWNAANNTNDIAAIKLERASTATPMPWAVPGQESLWAPGVSATVVGWGATSEGGSGSNALKEATVPVVSDTQCDAWYDGAITPSQHICAGYQQGGTDTCQGDSGGPLLVKDATNKFLLAGITSWGEGCARRERPGVYSEVAALSTFITAMTLGA